MNLLIVDDEIYVVRALKNNLDWNRVGIDQVFSAFSASKAKEIIEETPIDIVITDIEMPTESGLDFMRFIRSHKYDCRIICLTCHAEFRYAQEALHLGAAEYYVKPLNFQTFEELIISVVNEIKKEKHGKVQQAKGKLWDNNKNILETVFWEQILTGELDSKPEKILQEAEKNHIDYEFDVKYQMILIAIRKFYENKNEWINKQELLEYIIYNIALDIFLNKNAGKSGWSDDYMWAILPIEKADSIHGKLEEFVDVCMNVVGVGLVAYLGRPCFGEDIHSEFQKLKDFDIQNVSVMQGVIEELQLDCDHEDTPDFFYEAGIYLKEKKWEKLDEYNQLNDISCLKTNKRGLFLGIDIFMRAIHVYLENNRIHTEEFWTDELMKEYANISQSVEIFANWMKKAIKQLQKIEKESKAEKEIIIQIKSYVCENIEDKLNREQIAGHVCFSPNYVSKIFKREMGISLSEYIVVQKVEKAKKLMEEGNENIGEIAERLGYSSFSYFTEIFKRKTGYLPSEYRRKN